MRILLLLPAVPFRPTTGQRHRFALVARGLAQRHEVSLAAFAAPGDENLPQEADRLFGAVRTVPVPSAILGGRIAGWLWRDPSEVGYFRSAQMVRNVTELVGRFDPQVVIVGDPALTPYVARLGGLVRVLDDVCEVMLNSERLAALANGPERLLWQLRRFKYAQYLKRIAPLYDLCVLNSQEDLDSLARIWPAAKLRLITNGLDLSAYPFGSRPAIPGRMIYPGSTTYEPNRDAVTWFAETMLPAIRARLPDAELVVTGAVPASSGKPVEAPGLRYLGHVEDVKAEIAASSVTVVPLRLGAGGARFKVLESLALGTPIVSTAIGYEGLAVTDRNNILAAEDPETFAARTIEVLTSPQLRTELAANGRRLMEDVYNWLKLGGVLEAELARRCASRFGMAT